MNLFGIAAFALVVCAAARAEASDCAAQFAGERLQLRCLTSQLQKKPIEIAPLVRTDSILANQGYKKRFGLVPSPSNPFGTLSIYPILQYSSDINGGNPAGNLLLGDFSFEPDPNTVKQSGVLLGAGASAEGRFLLGEGRYVQIDLATSYVRSPEYDLGIESLIGAVCSKNHLENWWYLDACATSIQVRKELSDDDDKTLSVSLSKVFATDHGSHHDASLRIRKLFTSEYIQNQLTISIESISKSDVFSSIYLNIGEPIDYLLVSKWAVGGSIGTMINGRRVKAFAAYEVSDGGVLLGTLQTDRVLSVGLSYQFYNSMSLFLGYQTTNSSVDYFDISEPTVGIELAKFTF